MARPAQDVTEAELGVLQALWGAGGRPLAIRAIVEELHPGDGGASRYATVQKLLERLESKGFVGRDRGANPQLFSAAIDRDELIGRRLRAVAETLCDGSMTPLLTHLVGHGPLSAEERRALRALVETLDRESPGPTA